MGGILHLVYLPFRDVLAYVEANGLKAVSPKPVPSPEVATQTAKPETKPEVRPEQAALAKPPAPPAAPAATPVKEQVIISDIWVTLPLLHL